MSEHITITGCPLCSSPVQAIKEKSGTVYRTMPWNSLVHRLDTIRAEHNGVFGIYLFMGHDGHFSCEFKDYDKTISKGESGRSLFEAVDRCIDSWNRPERPDLESSALDDPLTNAKKLAQGAIEMPTVDLGKQVNMLARAILDLAIVIEHLKGGAA
jgi:hypothetical protein